MVKSELTSTAPILSLEDALSPLLDSACSFSDQRKLLRKMYAMTLCNAPDDEIDNFTAKELSPFFLALSETLDNLEILTRQTAI